MVVSCVTDHVVEDKLPMKPTRTGDSETIDKPDDENKNNNGKINYL